MTADSVMFVFDVNIHDFFFSEMAPKKQLEKSSWSWAETTDPDSIGENEVRTAYRLTLQLCKGNCRWVSQTVIEIACSTDAQDWQKQCWSGKATVYAGLKDRESFLIFRSSWFWMQNSKLFDDLNFYCSHVKHLIRTGLLLHFNFMQHYLVIVTTIGTTFWLLHISSVHQK